MMEREGLTTKRVACAGILIMDRNRLFADSLAELLRSTGFPDVQVHSPTGTAPRDEASDPRLLILGGPLPPDLHLGLRLQWPNAETLVLLEGRDEILERRLARAGFTAWIPRQTGEELLPGAVRAALGGRRVVASPPRRGRTAGLPREERLLHTLTRREVEILSRLAQGAGGQAIAQSLKISPATVRAHVRSILTKLHVSSRLEAALIANRHPWYLMDAAGQGA